MRSCLQLGFILLVVVSQAGCLGMIRAITDPVGTASASGERLAWNLSDDLTRAAEETLGSNDLTVNQLDQILTDHPDAANKENLARMRDELASRQGPQTKHGQKVAEKINEDPFSRQQQIRALEDAGIMSAAAYFQQVPDHGDHRHDRHHDSAWQQGSHIDQLGAYRQLPTTAATANEMFVEKAKEPQNHITLEPYSGQDPYERFVSTRHFMPGWHSTLVPPEPPLELIGLDGQSFRAIPRPPPWRSVPW